MVNLRDLTFLLIKPDGMPHKEEIQYEIENVLQLKIPLKNENYVISEELAELYYLDHAAEGFYRAIVQSLSEKPTCKMIITGRDALERVLIRSGQYMDPDEARKKEPKTWRALYGGDRVYLNVVHRPKTQKELMRDVRIHFSVAELMSGKLSTQLIQYIYGI